MESIERDLLTTNEAFYQAVHDRDPAAMDRLWARTAKVACMHPGMRPIRGRDEVMRSWRGILKHPGAPRIVCTEAEAHVFGTFGFVTCLEGLEGEPGRLAATNIFVRENNKWRVVHHQAGPLTAARQPDVDDDDLSDSDVDLQMLN